jgi:SAM-dependent methyltransferase
MNRVQFINFLASDWMPGRPDVHERLQSGGRIADVACGTGWSTIALARAYPNAEVHGLDLDEASIQLARANAAQEGMEIPFEVRDAADPGLRGRYDLVTCFEAVHDMPRPVESLRGMRSLLADSGVLLIADERVADQFTPPGDEVERVMYGFSLFHCLAVGARGAALGCHRHSDAAQHPARVRRRRRLHALRDPADRERLLALLPARGLSPVAALTRRTGAHSPKQGTAGLRSSASPRMRAFWRHLPSADLRSQATLSIQLSLSLPRAGVNPAPMKTCARRPTQAPDSPEPRLLLSAIEKR